MKVDVAIVNAFIDDQAINGGSGNGGSGGNPAGVVLDADKYSNRQKLAIAKEVGLSETAFVSSSKVADIKLEFFTPERQIAHCGHATVATFSYLNQQGVITKSDSSKETIDGNRNIKLIGNKAYMEQLAPTYSSVKDDKAQILNALHITEDQLISDPKLVNTGNAFILIGVKSNTVLASIEPNQQAIERLSEKYDLIGFYVFTLETHQEGRDAATRMFAPRYGIAEESATGMAAGPLACFLFDYLDQDKATFFIEQGYAMQPSSPSMIEVKLTLENAAIKSLIAGGVGKVTRHITVDI